MTKENKFTFFAKNESYCPSCRAEFLREELLTGRGRLIAGDLTDELRRKYVPSAKFGEVYPLVYTIVVCPDCYYAAFAADFQELTDECKNTLLEKRKDREKLVQALFQDIDFRSPRTLREGAAAYVLATVSYDLMPKGFSPTIKQGICSLRAAWLLGELHGKFPGENWDYLARLFYRKASFFYTEAVISEGDGRESLAEVSHLGPDLDKNYGYDGVLYMAALLEYRYGPRGDENARRNALEEAKRTVSRVFGMGKATKNKPTALLDWAKQLFSKMGEELGSNPELD